MVEWQRLTTFYALVPLFFGRTATFDLGFLTPVLVLTFLIDFFTLGFLATMLVLTFLIVFFALDFLAFVLILDFFVDFFTSAFSPNLNLLLFFPSSRAFLKTPFSTPFFNAKARYMEAFFSSPTSWTPLICFRMAVLEHPVLSLSSFIASMIITEYLGCEGPALTVTVLDIPGIVLA